MGMQARSGATDTFNKVAAPTSPLPACGERVRVRGNPRRTCIGRWPLAAAASARRPSSACRHLLPAGGEKGTRCTAIARTSAHNRTSTPRSRLSDWIVPTATAPASPLPACGERVRVRGNPRRAGVGWWPASAAASALRPSSACRHLLPAGGEKGTNRTASARTSAHDTTSTPRSRFSRSGKRWFAGPGEGGFGSSRAAGRIVCGRRATGLSDWIVPAATAPTSPLPACGERVRVRGNPRRAGIGRWPASAAASALRPSSACRHLLPAGGEKGTSRPAFARTSAHDRTSAPCSPLRRRQPRPRPLRGGVWEATFCTAVVP